MLKTAPAVFAVEDHYQIMVEVTRESLMSVKIGDHVYYDETNGIMNSLSSIHRVDVPMAALDQAKQYTVCITPLVERKAYYTETEPVSEYPFDFLPVPLGEVRLYHISDAHNQTEKPIRAAKAFGKIDLLVLNGDIIDHCGSPDKFENLYLISAELTHGSIPVVCSRGNHDLRGNFAEKYADFTPNHNYKTYYTFRLGSLWGMILDCGEDKGDHRIEYGHTVACHPFRERQTDYISDQIYRADSTYRADGVKTRLVLSHIPFTMKFEDPFDIETDIYRKWASLLKEHVKPHLMLCGHTHIHGVYPAGAPTDHLGQPCTILIGGAEPQDENFIGYGLVIHENDIEAVFTDGNGNVLLKRVIPKTE